MASPDLAARVDALGATPVQGHFYRHVAAGRDARSGSGARINGGRWNPPESYSTVYLGEDIDTVVREFYRLARRQGLHPRNFLPRDLYTFEVELEAVLDLCPQPARQRLGLSDAELRSDDASYCQAVGEAAHYLELEGVLAPSATGEGVVLAVFFPRLRPTSRVEPVGVERWDEPPPEPELTAA